MLPYSQGYRDRETAASKAGVLLLCPQNSTRSQIAEGLLRHLAGDRFEAHSAGTEATHVRPLAAQGMTEIGADISHEESKTLERCLRGPFDYAVTVCEDANEVCPVFHGAKERPGEFRAVHDEIRALIEEELS